MSACHEHTDIVQRVPFTSLSALFLRTISSTPGASLDSGGGRRYSFDGARWDKPVVALARPCSELVELNVSKPTRDDYAAGSDAQGQAKFVLQLFQIAV